MKFFLVNIALVLGGGVFLLSCVVPAQSASSTNYTSTTAPDPVLHEPTQVSEAGTSSDETESTVEVDQTEPVDNNLAVADVIAVSVGGSEGAYQFSVEVQSPDTGCEYYADWWEVLSENGDLLYRRVLLHSHVGEQPFTRSGGPVAIQSDEIVWVRAHFNPGGYGGLAFKGSVDIGFEANSLPADFALSVAELPPLPENCAF